MAHLLFTSGSGGESTRKKIHKFEAKPNTKCAMLMWLLATEISQKSKSHERPCVILIDVIQRSDIFEQRTDKN